MISSEYCRKFKAVVNRISICCRLGVVADLEGSLVTLVKSMDTVSRNEASDGILSVLDSVCCVHVPVYIISWIDFAILI
jgi:hypothetical protein